MNLILKNIFSSEFEILDKFFLFFSGKGSAFLAAATPSPLTTPNPL